MPLKCILSKIDDDEYKKLEDFSITYGTVNTKFGKCLMGMHESDICFLSFIDDSSSSSGTNCSYSPNYTSELRKLFPNARLYEKNGKIFQKVQEVFDGHTQGEVKVLLKGSAFQIKIWEQLAKLKKGTTTTYEDIAKAIGHPKAVRSVASAIAKNNVAYLIPCHRVISKNKTLNNKYRWGAERKLNILREESAIAKKELISKYFSQTKKKAS